MLPEEDNREKSENWVEILKPIIGMETKYGGRIKTIVLQALAAGPPAWAQKRLEESISKEIYRNNAAGPTKHSVRCLLSEVLGEELKGPRLKPKTKHHDTKGTGAHNSKKIPDSATTLLTERCRQLLHKLRSMEKYQKLLDLIQTLCPGSHYVDRAIGISSKEIRCTKISPIRLGSVDVKVASGVYGSRPQLFVEDLQKVWKNVIGIASEIIFLAKSLGEIVEAEYKPEVETMGQLQKDMQFNAVNLCSKKQQQAEEHPVSEPENRCPQNGTLHERLEEVDCKVTGMEIPMNVPTNAEVDASCRVCRLEVKEEYYLSCNSCSALFHEGCLSEPILTDDSRSNWLCESCLCRVCRIDTDDDCVLLCDSCDRGYHTYCLRPPLSLIPQGHWFCDICIDLKEPSANFYKKIKTENCTRKEERGSLNHL